MVYQCQNIYALKIDIIGMEKIYKSNCYLLDIAQFFYLFTAEGI